MGPTGTGKGEKCILTPSMQPMKCPPVQRRDREASKVCGCNHVEYRSECDAKAAGVPKWTKGPCGRYIP